jgi:MHS family proline/betaine transporter-like MFS transporter
MVRHAPFRLNAHSIFIMSTHSRSVPETIAIPDRRAIVAAGIGNCLELFDLTVFGFFAVVIGTQFFPSADPLTSILGSFATFAIGFLMRPAGALILASIGDRHGRKALLTITMTLMGCASLGIALVPNYAQIGIAAPLLLVLFRLVQGFAAGGEWGGAVTMMVEHAPPSRRGFIGSFQQVGFGLGILAGTLCAALVNLALDDAARLSWGWRLPFLLGALVAPVALYIRKNVDESPEFKQIEAAGHRPQTPVRDAFAHHWRAILAVIGIGTAGTAGGYISSQFMSSFAVKSLGMPLGRVSLVISLASVLQVILIPFWGWLSDRIGGLIIIGGAALAYTLLVYPLFNMLIHSPGVATLAGVVGVSAVLVSASFGPLPALISAFFPIEIRTTAISIGYNFAAAIFGGFAPFVGTWLVRATGDLIAPTYYAIGCGIISAVAALIVALFMKRQPSYALSAG